MNHPHTAAEARIDALEIRIAYQDEIIEDLNRTLTSQWEQIDRLARQLAHVVERLQAAEERGGPAAPEPPPPHY
ncbi:SlyX family protein [Ancylobacter terrae]|uniref:SlyX family protein n=1 Tax=Ancylobacter sp. sgz301288 TaxID=3342077 RepID=UPI00385E8CE0